MIGLPPPDLSTHDPGTRPPRVRGALPSRRWVLLGGAAVALGAGIALVERRGEVSLPDRLVLATGPDGTGFPDAGADLAAAIQDAVRHTRVEVRSTSGSVDNVRMLALGVVDLGYVGLDVASRDYRVLKRSISGVARVFDSHLHLVVAAGSPIRTLVDLDGCRVAVGGPTSGTEYTTALLLGAAGVQPSATLRLAVGPALQALEAGEIDAVFSVSGIPTPAIAALARRMSVRLIPTAEYYPMLDREIPRVYASSMIPAGMYASIPQTPTMAVPNALLARPGISSDVVTTALDALLSDAAGRFRTHEISRQVSRNSAAALGSVRVHPAARTWLREH